MEHVEFIDYRPAISVDRLPRPSSERWVLVLCEPDGNCFYHALSKCTRKKQAQTIRMDLLRYIDRTQYQLPNIAEVAKRIFSGIEAEYKDQAISADGWANHEEVQLCARMYNIAICVWNSEFGMWTACFPRDDIMLLSQCRKAVYLYNDGSHFDLLVRKTNIVEVRSEKNTSGSRNELIQ